jgi:hypothetical protein
MPRIPKPGPKITSVTSSQPMLLDIPSAAKMLSVGPWAIRSLLWGRKIPFIKVGKKHLIDPADLRVFIDQTKAVA